MRNIARKWNTFKHGRKFAKKGKHCRFPHPFLEIDGHVEVGDNCRFRNNVVLRTKGEGKIIFGDRSGCSYFCVMEATKLIQIGTYTGIAEHTVIRDSNHLVYGTDEHWRYTPLIAEPVIIGEECLIGSRCYIGPGVTIGDGAIIHAGSIVTKDVGAGEIWAGAPARRIAHRTKNVPPARMRQYRELMEKYGMKPDRYKEEG